MGISIIHLVVFLLTWPGAPIILIYYFEIESFVFRFLIFGGFFLPAIVGSSLVTLMLSK